MIIIFDSNSLDQAEGKVLIMKSDARLDHQYVNELSGLGTPTCESLAVWCWDALSISLPGSRRIEVSENTHFRSGA